MDLESKAAQIVELLAAGEKRLVLAESCTGGLVASTLATVPGVSQWLAGSMVVYQEASKTQWLGVAAETIENHTAVSAPVAHQMVAGALKQTPHSEIAASVTGHLGPGAPHGFDGLIFVSVGRRGEPPRTYDIRLEKTKRVARQREAAMRVLESIERAL